MLTFLLWEIVVFAGIGVALAIAGRRYHVGPLWWSGVAILIVIGLYVVVNLLILISCWTGAGCL